MERKLASEFPQELLDLLIAPPASLSDSTRRIADSLGWTQALAAAVQRRIEYHFGLAWSEFEAERSGGSQELLVIHDGKDSEVPIADGLRHARAWPRARLLQTTGLGHRRLLADPTVIAATVDFLAGERP